MSLNKETKPNQTLNGADIKGYYKEIQLPRRIAAKLASEYQQTLHEDCLIFAELGFHSPNQKS